jgi:NAD(P)-dependent dehydrogenase (short-subunit alcohol dehydrogenase family)
MKYAITGHTAGIGLSLYRLLKPNCIGFSRTTGHNINMKQNRESIISDSVDCDVFINNAYSDINQVNLLYELYEIWKDSDKIIVNIGSETTCGIKNHPHIYTAHKIALDKASEQLSHLDNKCRVINIKFGWVGTPRVLAKFNPKSYIDVDDAAKYILEQIIWSTKYRVTECLVRP